jgi:hypothetical protein
MVKKVPSFCLDFSNEHDTFERVRMIIGKVTTIAWNDDGRGIESLREQTLSVGDVRMAESDVEDALDCALDGEKAERVRVL